MSKTDVPPQTDVEKQNGGNVDLSKTPPQTDVWRENGGNVDTSKTDVPPQADVEKHPMGEGEAVVISPSDEEVSSNLVPAWMRGTRGNRWRWMIVAIVVVEFAIILVGWTTNSVVKEKLFWWTVAAAFHVVFEVACESWLDAARQRVWSLVVASHPTSQPASTKQLPKAQEVHARRASYHVHRCTTGELSSLPYLGPGNWHYETTACIRDVILSLTVLVIYLASIRLFAECWDAIILATYMVDILFLAARWPFVSPSWLRFVPMHHIMVLVFLALSRFLTTQIHSFVLRAYAFVWLSNSFTTFPIVYRSFTGLEDKTMIATGILMQRALRWSGSLVGLVEILKEDFRYLFQTPHTYIVSALALVMLEVLDISEQWKKLRSLFPRPPSPLHPDTCESY